MNELTIDEAKRTPGLREYKGDNRVMILKAECQACYALEWHNPNDYSRNEPRKDCYYTCWLERIGKPCEYKPKHIANYETAFALAEDDDTDPRD